MAVFLIAWRRERSDITPATIAMAETIIAATPL